jgi:hypothetical protein
MNEVLMKGALKMVKNFISAEQIKEAATSLIRMAVDYKETVPMDAEKGEHQVIAIFYQECDSVNFALAIINEDNQMLRFEQVKPLDELIDSLIQKI